MDPSDMTDLHDHSQSIEDRVAFLEREFLRRYLCAESQTRQMDEQFAALAIANVRLKRKLRKQARELRALDDTVIDMDARLTVHTEASAEAGHGDLRG